MISAEEIIAEVEARIAAAQAINELARRTGNEWPDITLHYQGELSALRAIKYFITGVNE